MDTTSLTCEICKQNVAATCSKLHIAHSCARCPSQVWCSCMLVMLCSWQKVLSA